MNSIPYYNYCTKLRRCHRMVLATLWNLAGRHDGQVVLEKVYVGLDQVSDDEVLPFRVNQLQVVGFTVVKAPLVTCDVLFRFLVVIWQTVHDEQSLLEHETSLEHIVGAVVLNFGSKISKISFLDIEHKFSYTRRRSCLHIIYNLQRSCETWTNQTLGRTR